MRTTSKMAPASELSFEFGLCRCRPTGVPARQVYAGDLGTQCQLPGYLFADPGVGAHDRYQWFLRVRSLVSGLLPVFGVLTSGMGCCNEVSTPNFSIVGEVTRCR